MANCDIGDSDLEVYEFFIKDRDIKNEKGKDKKGSCVLLYVQVN